MAKWIKVSVSMQNGADLETKQRLDIPAMEVSSVFRGIVLNVDFIAAYSHLYDDEGNVVEGKSEISLSHGGSMVVDLPFYKLNTLINGKPEM